MALLPRLRVLDHTRYLVGMELLLLQDKDCKKSAAEMPLLNCQQFAQGHKSFLQLQVGMWWLK